MINIKTIWRRPNGDNSCTQLPEDIGCDVIGCTIGTIQHNLKTIESQIPGYCAFTKFDLPATGIDDAGCLAQFF